MTQLIMAVVSACQVVFMISRAPKVPWEAIYLPLSEMITYALAYTGHGYVCDDGNPRDASEAGLRVNALTTRMCTPVHEHTPPIFYHKLTGR